jgi:hypothetical protein
MASDKAELIFFGRLEERKGLIEFIEAIKGLAASERPNFRVTFLGKNVPLVSFTSDETDSEKLIKVSLSGKVEFAILSNFDRAAAISYVRKASNSVVCLASPCDNFPNAALEMGQLPLRLVVSDTEGFRQTLSLIGRADGLHWFKPHCPDSLAEAIRSALFHRPRVVKCPSAPEIRKINEQLLAHRNKLIQSAFDTKQKRYSSTSDAIQSVVVLVPGACRTRAIRRSLLSLEKSNPKPAFVTVVGQQYEKAQLAALINRFPSAVFLEDDSISLQDSISANSLGPLEHDYAVVMIAGTALEPSALRNLGRAADTRPAAITSAEKIHGRPQVCRSFKPPSVSALATRNESCGSCIAVSIHFLASMPAIPVSRPALGLWLIMLGVSAQGGTTAYLPMPQHSVRRRSHQPLNTAYDEKELASVRDYVASINFVSLSKREIRNLILSVQQLTYGEAIELARLRDRNESMQSSLAWKITKPLRLVADLIREMIAILMHGRTNKAF